MLSSQSAHIRLLFALLDVPTEGMLQVYGTSETYGQGN